MSEEPQETHETEVDAGAAPKPSKNLKYYYKHRAEILEKRREARKLTPEYQAKQREIEERRAAKKLETAAKKDAEKAEKDAAKRERSEERARQKMERLGLLSGEAKINA